MGFEESWKVQICVSICSNLQLSALSLGEKKVFSGYLGTDQSKWKADVATHLVKSYPGVQLDILLDPRKVTSGLWMDNYYLITS